MTTKRIVPLCHKCHFADWKEEKESNFNGLKVFVGCSRNPLVTWINREKLCPLIPQFKAKQKAKKNLTSRRKSAK